MKHKYELKRRLRRWGAIASRVAIIFGTIQGIAMVYMAYLAMSLEANTLAFEDVVLRAGISAAIMIAAVKITDICATIRADVNDRIDVINGGAAQ